MSMMRGDLRSQDPATYGTSMMPINVRITNTPTNIIVQNFLFSMQDNCLSAVIIPLLFAVLQVRSLFETHLINMWIFLVAACIYYFSLFAAYYYPLFKIIGIIAASLSFFAMISVLPPGWKGYIVFVAWAFVSIIIVYKNFSSIRSAFGWFCQKINGNRNTEMELPRLQV